MRLGFIGIFFLAIGLICGTANARNLPRRAMLGVQPIPASADQIAAAEKASGASYSGGVLIQQVSGLGNAARMGLQPGDVVLTLNGMPMPDPQALISRALKLRGGETVTIEFLRNDMIEERTAVLQALPPESFPKTKTKLAAVSYDGGQLRAILTLPERASQPPVIFYIQGYPCSSVEVQSPGHPIRHFIEDLSARGFATWRVEKPGIGDSVGPVACADSDFAYERAAFEAGYSALLKRQEIDPSRIYVFGHSLGGIHAPFLAQLDHAPKGLIVYGTAVKPWGDYLLDIVHYQGVSIGDATGSAYFEIAGAIKPALYHLFEEGASLNELAEQNADAHTAFCGYFDCEEDGFLSRSLAFWQELHDQNIAAAWGRVGRPVLALAGGTDVAIIDPRDTKFIVDVVNAEANTEATYIEVAGTNHFMGQVGDRETARRHRAIGTYNSIQYNYNSEIGAAVAAWIANLEATIQE